jgi:hypothetical protein
MDWQDNPRFSIIEEAHYTAKFARLVRDPRLRDDIQRTFDEDIARNPYECEEVFGTRLRALTIACFPPLTIVFSIDETDRVIKLLDVDRLP